jgi:hypothetical protein
MQTQSSAPDSWEAVARSLDGVASTGLDARQLAYLHSLSASTTGRGAVVEIGTYVGKSTTSLAYAQKEKRAAPMHTIDVVQHHRLEATLEAAGVRDYVIMHVAPSKEVAEGWREPIELLWIDGDHSYRGVRADIRAWSSHVVEGGVVAFHDYPGIGWSQAVSRAIRHGLLHRPDRWRVRSDREHGSIFVLERLPTRRDFTPRRRRLLQQGRAAAIDVPALAFARSFPRQYEKLRRRLQD